MTKPTLLQTRQSHYLVPIEDAWIIKGPENEGEREALKPGSLESSIKHGILLMTEAEWELVRTDVPLESYEGILGLVGCVDRTCQELGLPEGWGRFNDWPQPDKALKPRTFEVACATAEETKAFVEILTVAGIKALPCPDEPGLISARITYLILAEGIRLLGDGLATDHDIDLSMKLGTNYPEGPITWARTWGQKRLEALQTALHRQDAERYPLVNLDVLGQGLWA